MKKKTKTNPAKNQLYKHLLPGYTQKEMKEWEMEIKALPIFALGPKGSYGHEAALLAQKNLGLRGEISFVSTNIDVLQGAEDQTGIAIIPVENSTYGDVVDVLGYLAKQAKNYPLSIMRQIELPVRHCLLVHGHTTLRPKVVMSHPQALGQCAVKIKDWGAETQVATSTAAAAKYVSEHPELQVGAIASELAANEYGLKVMLRDVQTLTDNMTRFFVFGSDLHATPTGRDKTVIIFKVPNEPAALFEALSPFALRGINMTAIHSVSLGEWKYGFYMELDGHAASTPLHQALEELTGKTLEWWMLGSFPK